MSASRSSSVSPGKKPRVNRLTSEPGKHHHLRAALTQSLGALGAIGEQVEQLDLCEAVGERTEPDVEASGRGVRRGDLQASGSPPVIRTAVQCRSSRITCISRRTTSGSKGSRVLVPVVEEAGVEVDALGSHGPSSLVASRWTERR